MNPKSEQKSKHQKLDNEPIRVKRKLRTCGILAGIFVLLPATAICFFASCSLFVPFEYESLYSPDFDRGKFWGGVFAIGFLIFWIAAYFVYEKRRIRMIAENRRKTK